MSKLFKFLADWSTSSIITAPVGDCEMLSKIDIRKVLSKQHYSDMSLVNDGYHAVNFGGIANTHVLIIKVDLAKGVRMKYTTSVGVDQIIPVQNAIMLLAEYDPITSLSIMREQALPTMVSIFLGEI